MTTPHGHDRTLKLVSEVVQGLLAPSITVKHSQFYRERVLANPDDPADLARELVPISLVGDFTPDTRIYWLLTIEDEGGREGEVSAKFYVSTEGDILIEGIRPKDVQLHSVEELQELQELQEDRSGIKDFLNTGISLANLFLNVLKIFLEQGA